MKKQLLFKNSILSNLINWINPFKTLTNRSLKVWGANVASLKSKGDDLSILLDKQKPDIVLLNETWLTNESTFQHPKYLQIASDFNQKYQGTCILLRNDHSQFYSCHQINHPNKNITEIILNIDPENKINFISIYAPPQGNDERDEQRNKSLYDLYETINIFSKEKQKNYKLIGYSDFNARLRKYIDYQDLDSKNILKSLKQLKVNLIYELNPRSYTRSGINFKNESTSSYIDYFFIKGISSYNNFKIKDSIGKSDHNLLEIYIKKQIQIKLWIYFILIILIPLIIYKKDEIHFDLFLDNIIDLIDEYLNFNNSGLLDNKQIVFIKQNLINPIMAVHQPYFQITAVIAIAFALFFYILIKFNRFIN